MPRADLTEADGRQLAIDMMRELQEEYANRADMPEDATDADLPDYIEKWLSSPPTLMRRYLSGARKGGRKVERGFLCVVSDFIASCYDGSPDPEYYEKHLEPRTAPPAAGVAHE